MKECERVPTARSRGSAPNLPLPLQAYTLKPQPSTR
jgi:hypothetical protein